MGKQTQPGGRVDEHVYERFREFVRSRHGKVRGALGTELEKAMEERMNAANGPDSLTRIENDIATIKAQLAESDADGGTVATPTPSGEPAHTHAPNDTHEKPNPNAPRAEKVRWLVDEKYDRSGGSILVSALKDDIRGEFNFGDRTVPKYIQPIVDELDAKRHPANKDILVWGNEIGKITEGDE